MLYLFLAVFSLLASLLRLVSGSQSLFSELQVHGDRRVVQSLLVGVAENECDVVYTFAVHVVYGIAAATAHSDDFYYAAWLVRLAEG